MRNVTIIPSGNFKGKQCFKLIGPYGEIHAFEFFIRRLHEEGYAPNTIAIYKSSIAYFLDYMFEAQNTFQKRGVMRIDKAQLKKIIYHWAEYLTFGENSGDPMVKEISTLMPSPMVTSKTSSTYHAGLKKFLELSDEIQKEHEDLSKLGVINDFENRLEHLFSNIGQVKLRPALERVRMAASSMLPGVIANGAKTKKVTVLNESHLSVIDDNRVTIFPFDRFKDFYDNLLTYRDRAYYNFLGASGARGHEARQMLWADVRPDEREVFLVNPGSRINHSSYLALSIEQRNKLAWKGRESPETFLVEPFASLFWQNLELYLKHEYIPHGRHDFVFQVLEGDTRGDPYFTADHKSWEGVFKRACRLAKVPSNVRGAHSLRHSYGTYALNYFPLPNGEFGLPITIVRIMMGHKDLKATQLYAQKDRDILRAQLIAAESFSRSIPGSMQSASELQIKALLSSAKKLGWDGEV